jgi:hypothetical protein
LAPQLYQAKGHDIFIVKLDKTGNTVWAAQAGGTAQDFAWGLDVDVSGNVYISGQIQGEAHFGNITLTPSANSYDFFIAKYNNAGQIVWAKRAGGNGSAEAFAQAKAIIVDDAGNAYVTGSFAGSVTFEETVKTADNSEDIFVAKYNSSGSLQWINTAGGGEDWDSGDGIAVDGSGNVYICGDFNGTTKFCEESFTSAGESDFFLAKYNSSGVFQWANRGGSTGDDWCTNLAIDKNDNLYITGAFTNTASFNSITLTSVGDRDGYLAKYTSGGNIVWASKFGGDGIDSGVGILIDDATNIYLTGYYGSSTLSDGSHTINNNGDAFTDDLFAAKYNSSGEPQWLKGAGGDQSDVGNSIGLDNDGNIYLLGHFESTATFGTNTLTALGDHSYDILFWKFKP